LQWYYQLTRGLSAGGHLHRIAFEQLGVEVLHVFARLKLSGLEVSGENSFMSVIANNCVYFYSHTKGEYAAFSQFFRSTVKFTDSAVSAGSY
jgi:hypothetical protein